MADNYDLTEPDVVRNKKFGPIDIKWVKTVNDDKTFSAYLPQDKRLIYKENCVFFHLQCNIDFREKLLRVPPGDLILLYQNLKDDKNRAVKCFTHLVTPIDNNIIQTGNEWCGRLVKVIAMTENKEMFSINFDNTIWKKLGWSQPGYQNLTIMPGYVWNLAETLGNPAQCEELQNNIWEKFQKGKYFSPLRGEPYHSLNG